MFSPPGRRAGQPQGGFAVDFDGSDDDSDNSEHYDDPDAA